MKVKSRIAGLLFKEAVSVFLVPLGIYALLAFGLMFFSTGHIPPFPEFVSEDEIDSYFLTKAVAEKGTLEITDFVPSPGWSTVYQGKDFSGRPPGLSFIAVPFYLLGKFVGFVAGLQGPSLERFTYFSSSIVCALSGSIAGYLVYKLSLMLGFSPRASLFSSYTFCFATIALRYSRTFMDHSPSAALIALAAYAIIREGKALRSARTKLSIVSGLALGYSVLLRYSNAFLIPFFLGYAVWKRRGFFPLLVSTLLSSSILLAYNYSCFGDPLNFATMYLASQGQYGNPPSSSLKEFFFFLFIPTPLTPGLLGILIGPKIGLFYYSPILLISIAGLLLLYRRQRSEVVLFTLCAIVTILIYGLLGTDGKNWSARYLSPIVPFLSLSISPAFDRWSSRKYRLALLKTLLLWSTFSQTLGIYPCFYFLGPSPLLIALQFLSSNVMYAIGVLFAFGMITFLYKVQKLV